MKLLAQSPTSSRSTSPSRSASPRYVYFTITASVSNVTLLGGLDSFGAKIVPATGALVAVGTSGSALGDEQGTSIAVDASTNIYLAEIYENTMNMDYRGGVYNVTAGGSTDFILARYDQTAFGADATAQATSFIFRRYTSVCFCWCRNEYQCGLLPVLITCQNLMQ